MDPLLSRLSKDFVNDSDLHEKIGNLFKVAIDGQIQTDNWVIPLANELTRLTLPDLTATVII